MSKGSRYVGCGIVLVLLFVPAGRAQEGSTERSARPFLGIAVGPVQAGERGAVVKEVLPDSPAAKAGLITDDRILKVENQDVPDAEKFLQAVASHKPGDKLTLRVARGGQEQNITVTLGERPAAAGGPPAGLPPLPSLPGGRRPAFLGVQAQVLTPELKKRMGSAADAGVMVTEVVPNSPAAKAGLKSEDVITTVNDQPVRDPAQLREAVQQAGPGKEVALHVMRGKDNLTLRARLRQGTFGMFLTPGDEPFPTLDVESLMATAGRVRELERRLETLERQVRELEKKQAAPSR